VALDRLERILAALEPEAGEQLSAQRLCDVGADLLALSGAGVMLMSGDLPVGSLCSRNAVSAMIEELQYTLGEGPCIDAYREDRVVIEPDLARPGLPRWFAFTPKAVEAGVRAVFGFPIRLGAVRLGALNLYRDSPGPLSGAQHADALTLAEVIARWVLDRQAHAAYGSLAEELEVGADLYGVVHNAAGAVSVQLGVSVTEAMIRLRAYAFSHERLLRDVAQDVVERRLRLE
jgi:GAF domain-containing protein